MVRDETGNILCLFQVIRKGRVRIVLFLFLFRQTLQWGALGDAAYAKYGFNTITIYVSVVGVAL